MISELCQRQNLKNFEASELFLDLLDVLHKKKKTGPYRLSRPYAFWIQINKQSDKQATDKTYKRNLQKDFSKYEFVSLFRSSLSITVSQYWRLGLERTGRGPKLLRELLVLKLFCSTKSRKLLSFLFGNLPGTFGNPIAFRKC